MKRWQILSAAVGLLIAASFVVGAHKAIGLAGVVGTPWEPQASRVPSGESCSGDVETSRAPNPDPAMSNACERSCAAKHVDPAKVVAQPKARVGDLTRCPVSGVVFEVVEKNASVPYAGKEWVTCCGVCAKKLAATPERFLGSWLTGGGTIF